MLYIAGIYSYIPYSLLLTLHVEVVSALLQQNLMSDKSLLDCGSGSL